MEHKVRRHSPSIGRKQCATSRYKEANKHDGRHRCQTITSVTSAALCRPPHDDIAGGGHQTGIISRKRARLMLLRPSWKGLPLRPGRAPPPRRNSPAHPQHRQHQDKETGTARESPKRCTCRKRKTLPKRYEEYSGLKDV